MNINLNVKYYYIMNEDLNMSKGKIASQVSHVAMQLGEHYNEIGRAVILKAPESKLIEIISIPLYINKVFYILDAGLTEVPPNSLTCIGFKATDISIKFTEGLKLV